MAAGYPFLQLTMAPIKVLAARLSNRNNRYLNGESVTNGSLDILVDRYPNFIYRQSGNFFFSEQDGFCKIYEHEKGTTDGFGGSKINLTMECGEVMKFAGSLWDPYRIPNWPEIPKMKSCGITTDPKAYERGYTFQSGRVTQSMYDSLIRKIGIDDRIRRIDPSAAIKAGLQGIDYIDLVIFDFIRWAIESHNFERRTFDVGSHFLWTKVPAKTILECLPMLNCCHRSVSRRVLKLVKAGMIDRKPEQDKDGNYWICIGTNGKTYLEGMTNGN